MALPRLNEQPQYELTIPSTGQLVQYRPFLVKEQKVLIMALESQDQRQQLNAILNSINACVQDVDVHKLATFDVEYVFTQIRTKSVGETTKIVMKCAECSADKTVSIDLEQVKLDEEPKIKNKVVNLTKDISVELKYPTYNEFLRNTNEQSSAVDMVFSLMDTCISAIILNEEERIDIKDETPEEIENFINSLNAEQFEKLRNFVDEIPKISLDVEFECEACNAKNKRTLEGLNDFFS